MNDPTSTSINDADLIGYFEKLSNWGRWGKEDQRGTLNFITPEKQVRAARLVQRGRAVSCSRTISPRWTPENPRPLTHFMTASGEGAPKKGMGFASDWIGMEFHGHSYTHLDSLSHIFWNGMMYNGRPSTNITTSKGGKDGSVEWASGGIVSRGVLLDIPRLQNKEWLEPGEAVTPEHLNACEKAEGLTVGSGDILVIRNGRDARSAKKGVALPEKHGTPGLHASCLPWLREREIAVLCSDVAQDVMPSGFAVAMPVHAVGITAMGLWLVDNASLEELAAVCSEENRWEFQFIISALPLKNTTGSPVNPIAIF